MIEGIKKYVHKGNSYCTNQHVIGTLELFREMIVKYRKDNNENEFRFHEHIQIVVKMRPKLSRFFVRTMHHKV